MAEGKEFGRMDTETFSKGMLNFIRFKLDAPRNSIAIIQEFNDKILKGMIETRKAIQEDAAKKTDQFIENMKEGRDEYRRAVEENLKILFITSDLFLK